MGLFRRRKQDWVDPGTVSPDEALRLARDGLARTATYVDSHGRRRKMSDEQRAQMEAVFDKLEAARRTEPH